MVFPEPVFACFAIWMYYGAMNKHTQFRSDLKTAFRSSPDADQPTLAGDGDCPLGIPVSIPFGSDSPLGPDEMAAFALAERRSGKIRSALSVAMFNSVCLGLFGGLSLLFGLGQLGFGIFDWVNLVMGAGLSWMCYTELRGRAMLRRFDIAGARVLGRNQLALMVLIVAYAAWMMFNSLTGPSPFEQVTQLDPHMGHAVEKIMRSMTIIFYAALIAATLIFQGLMARYYFKRTAMLHDYLAETPQWIIELQRSRIGT